MNYLKKRRNIELTRQTFSRRLKKLEEDCIIGHRVQIQARTFDIHNPVLLIGTAPSEFLKLLANHLQKSVFPFTSTFKYSGNQFLWYIHLPATHLADLIYALRPHLTEFQVHVVDYDRSMGFFLYADAFDEKSHSWINSPDFIVHDVIKELDAWEEK